MMQFRTKKDKFALPEDVIYLDGNSLGPLPRCVPSVVSDVVEREWGEQLIRAWNSASWADQPRRVGDKIARLIGAPKGTVVMGDTLSIKVYQALAAALRLKPKRRIILSDTGNFPTDLYMAEGLIKTLDQHHELRLVEPQDVAEALTDDVAVLMLTEVDYKTGRLHDMKALSALAAQAGVITLWDLAHSAGALPVDVAGCGADFAVGCTYKYLNGGPGAPAFIYIKEERIHSADPALAGWFGHEAPFAFDLNYRPAKSIERMRVGTPPVIQMSVLESALKLWDDVSLKDLRARSIELSELFIAHVEDCCPDLVLRSPRDPMRRGSQVSFEFEHGYAAIQALIHHGVIGDFRAPNIMRFGITPLYLDEKDILRAVEIMSAVLSQRLWDVPKFKRRAAVT